MDREKPDISVDVPETPEVDITPQPGPQSDVEGPGASDGNTQPGQPGVEVNR